MNHSLKRLGIPVLWQKSIKAHLLLPSFFSLITKGLFTADQQLQGDLPIYTRQNAAGTRRGLEVPEERDYFPYWGPDPWKDIAIMVSDKKTEALMKKYVNSPEYGYKCEFLVPHILTSVMHAHQCCIFFITSLLFKSKTKVVL